MESRLPRFVRALRLAGVRVSTSEEVDAARAIGLLGMAERATFRAALFATLVKDPRDLASFERLFAAFFDAPASLAQVSEDAARWAELMDDPTIDGIARDIAAAMAANNAAALEALFAEAHERIDLPLRYPFQRALMVQKMAERLEVDRLRRAMTAPGQGGGLAAGMAKTGQGRAPDPIDALTAAIERYVARALARHVEPTPGAADRSGIYPPFEMSEEEHHATARAAALLARRLREQNARRRRRNRRGRIDVRATIRASMATGGIPFSPKWRRVRPDRPTLVALCDVSPSMRSTTRFTLLFLHSIAAEVARVRSFFFVDQVAEVTGFFQERRIGRAVMRALAEADLDVGARTDYGASFRDFDRRFGRTLTKRTTLVILGDARSNYTDPGYEILRSWRRKVKRIVFLNPEAPIFWGTGDSAMLRYRPICDVVAECRTPAHLLRVVDALSGRGTPRDVEPPRKLVSTPRF
jgi:uncharacterized protein with von Willebrand factor type A (vWA) domain